MATSGAFQWPPTGRIPWPLSAAECCCHTGMTKEEKLGSNELRSSPGAPSGVRQVTDAVADRVTELFALAFYDDPTWSWAFPDPEQRMDQHRLLWGLFLHSALPYGWVWITDDGGAASLWIPPGEPELSEVDEAQLEPLVRELVGSHADEVLGCSITSMPTIPGTSRTTT